MSWFSVSFIVFISMFFYAFCKALVQYSIVLLPSSAILTNLTFFIFHVPNTTVCCCLLLNIFVIRL